MSSVTIGRARRNFVREAREGHFLQADIRGLPFADASFDMVYTDFNDPAGLEEESRFAREIGFTGKTCIHPNQTPVVNGAFSPAAEEVERARRLVAAFDEQLAAGAGAFTFDGKMVDMPMLVAARKVLARAEH